ncbi:uncharacterized protein CELE_D1007.18 [Caenorhabditis elegans]|uniref:Secreted protein n=1 Tax=Caenorhabditis elegans TaxID=6239 RepID=Q4W529_CAEEL|nr:Secreted protein [Caenorhabditis elegans]CCD67328.1 Secreted protein [Caenorhabditis elegans]|eukprot:NP_001021070.2 Uncharacterized protein CELE_D1007.18 [Caenorhabditis elegans]
MVLNYRVFAFLLLVLILENASASEQASTNDVATGVSGEKPDVIIKLIKRGAAERLSDSSNEQPRDKRKSSSRKSKGRKVGKK